MAEISRKIISAILDKYGGQSKYIRNKKFTNSIVFDDKNRPGSILTIEMKYKKENGKPYIEVRISDDKGRSYQTDCYEVLFEKTELYLVSTKKAGEEIQYMDEKIAYVGPNTKAYRTKYEMERKIRELTLQNNTLEEINKTLLKNSEQEFLNSKTYVEMLEKISYLESVKKFNEGALTDAEARLKKNDADISQIYEDNKKLVGHNEDGDEEYFIGITENWHEAWEYEKLEKEIERLKGNISANSVLLIQREKEIQDLIRQLAAAKKELSDIQASAGTGQSTEIDSKPEEQKNHVKQDHESVEKSAVATEDMSRIIEKMEENIQEERIKHVSETKKRGRKPKVTEENRNIIITLYRKGYTIRDISLQINLSIGTVFNVVKKNKNTEE